MNRRMGRHTTRDGAAVALFGFLALVVTGTAVLVAVPELFYLVRAATAPIALAPL